MGRNRAALPGWWFFSNEPNIGMSARLAGTRLLPTWYFRQGGFLYAQVSKNGKRRSLARAGPKAPKTENAAPMSPAWGRAAGPSPGSALSMGPIPPRGLSPPGRLGRLARSLSLTYSSCPLNIQKPRVITVWHYKRRGNQIRKTKRFSGSALSK